MVEFNAIMDYIDEKGDVRISTNKPTRKDLRYIAYLKKYDIHIPMVLRSLDTS